MKTAHLFLVHNHPQHLYRVIQRMNHPDFDFYIHLDRKQPIEPFLPLLDFPNVFFIKKRVKVRWGGYSIVQATLNGILEISKSSTPYKYINLLSGQDYPLKPAEELALFYREQDSHGFIEVRDVVKDWTEALPRFQFYDLTDLGIRGKTRIQSLMNLLLPKRKIPYNMHPYGHSMFWMLPTEMAFYVANTVLSDRKLKRFFSMVWAADELTFQTILMHSKYKDSLINNNYRYIDWSEKKSSPKLLNELDFPKLRDVPMLFARKMDSLYSEKLLNEIDKQLLRV